MILRAWAIRAPQRHGARLPRLPELARVVVTHGPVARTVQDDVPDEALGEQLLDLAADSQPGGLLARDARDLAHAAPRSYSTTISPVGVRRTSRTSPPWRSATQCE